MKLKCFTENPEESYIYSERYLNFPEALEPWSLGDLEKVYSASEGDKKIPLKLFKIPLSEVKIYLPSGTNRGALKEFADEEGAFFAVHPQDFLGPERKMRRGVSLFYLKMDIPRTL